MNKNTGYYSHAEGGYYAYADHVEVTEKLKELRRYQASLLTRTYVKYLISNLYIIIAGIKRGYANEMVGDNALTNYSNEATSSIIPFFNEYASIIRGLLVDDNTCRLKHSWIEFNSNGKTYIFDPAFNLIVSKDDYKGIFLPETFASVSAKQVKTDLMNILANGQRTDDEWIIINGSSDINSSFYNTNIQIKGEEINHKLLTLTTKYNQKQK